MSCNRNIKMERHDIDTRILNELGDLRVNPPVEAWMVISEALDNRRGRRKFLPFFRKAAAAITILTLATFSIWLIISDSRDEQVSLSGFTAPASLQTIELADVLTTGIAAGQTAEMSHLYPMTMMYTLNEDIPVFGGYSFINGLYPLSAVLSSETSPQLYQQKEPASSHTIQSQFEQSSIQAQTTESTILSYANRPAAGVRLGAHFAPQYNYRVNRDHNDVFLQQIPFEALEDRILTYSFGFNAFFQLSEKWALQTGVGYTQMGQFVKDIIVYSHPGNIPLYRQGNTPGFYYHPQTIITSQGSIRFSDPHHYFADIQSYRVITNKSAIDNMEIRTLIKSDEGITQMFRFLEVPVVFRYNVISRNTALHLKAGLSGNYLLQNDVFTGNNIMQQSIGETYGVKQFNLAAMGGIALDISLTGNLTFHLEPTAQIFVNPLLREGVMTGRSFPYSYSLQTGISYGF
ncbi:MAG: hypothetical protein EA394_01870 [Bacteroidia bacterium]|nr:MAG: hypothetical protein EA394_01870 [Bacteroidia bacterium]